MQELATDNTTFIKLSRKILEWGWYKDVNTYKLFTHLLLVANIDDREWEGQLIKRGQFVTSIKHLSDETGLTVKETRTALNHLIRTNEVANTSTTKFRVITINNYDKYQNRAKREANKGQSEGKQRATTKEYKNIRNIYNVQDAHCAHFEKIWSLYPTKRGKGKVSDTKKKVLAKISLEEWERIIDRYKKSVKADRESGFNKRYQDGSTFFNSGYVDYTDSNYTEPEDIREDEQKGYDEI